MDEKSEFADRLSKAMKTAGYEARPAILEKEFNARYWGRSVTFQAVSRWLRGEAIPSQDKLQVLAEWLGVEPHILRFGEHIAQRVRERQQRWDEGIGHLEREVFEAFLGLPAPQRKAIREVILALANNNQLPRNRA